MLRPYKGTLPRVHASAYIDQTAQVIGDVEMHVMRGTHPTRMLGIRDYADRYLGYKKDYA
jgi:carbonic anhydrase/acetyltransferase-like protein (isoleucine patch superfamily)